MRAKRRLCRPPHSDARLCLEHGWPGTSTTHADIAHSHRAGALFRVRPSATAIGVGQAELAPPMLSTWAVVHGGALRGLEAAAVTIGRAPATGLPSFAQSASPPPRSGARARSRHAADERPRVPAQQACDVVPGADRSAEGVGPLQATERPQHPCRGRSIDAARLEAYEFAGELSLGGELRQRQGSLAIGLSLHRGARPVERARILLRAASADDTASVGGLSARVFTASCALPTPSPTGQIAAPSRPVINGQPDGCPGRSAS